MFNTDSHNDDIQSCCLNNYEGFGYFVVVVPSQRLHMNTQGIIFSCSDNVNHFLSSNKMKVTALSQVKCSQEHFTSLLFV